MATFKQRLQREIARRDHALAGLARCGRSSSAIVSQTLDETKHSFRTEIEHVNACVSNQIRATGTLVRENIEQTGATLGHLVRDNIDQTGATIGRQIDGLKASLSPAKLIQEHPWGATLAAAAAGAVLAPTIKAHFTGAPSAPNTAAPLPAAGTNSESGPDTARDSRWTPIITIIAESLPALLAAYLNRKPTRAERT